jgi:hypothetical protein
MNDGENATHRHKRLGEVTLLRSTAELGQVSTLSNGEKLWVKLTDLSDLAESGKQNRPRKERKT